MLEKMYCCYLGRMLGQVESRKLHLTLLGCIRRALRGSAVHRPRNIKDDDAVKRVAVRFVAGLQRDAEVATGGGARQNNVGGRRQITIEVYGG
jgi:hypothetical protein